MRRVALTLILALTLTAGASAQQSIYPDPPWCPTCMIVGNIDTPSYPGTTTVDYNNWYMAGWAFMCHNGGLPSRIDVGYVSDSNTWVELPDRDIHLNLTRTDVYNAYNGACPGTPTTSGLHIYFNTKPPVGTRQVVVKFWYGDVLMTQTRTVTIQ